MTISALIKTTENNLELLASESTDIQDPNLKIEITDAKTYLNEQITSPGLEAVAMPFFTAFKNDPNRFAMLVVDFISCIFQFSEPNVYPTEKLLQSSLDLITEIATVTSEDTKLKACKSLSAIIQSVSGNLFLHGENLYKYYNTILTLYDSVNTKSRSAEVIEMILHETMRIVIGAYDSIAFHPLFLEINELGEYTVKQIILYSLYSLQEIPKYAEFATINDVDMTVAIKYLSILESKFSYPARMLILNTLLAILKSRSSFFTKPFFPKIMKLYVLPLVLQLINDPTFDNITIISDLILIIWSTYTLVFEKGLHKIFNAILEMLTSKKPEDVNHACDILQQIAINSCIIFVDVYCRFDANPKYSNVLGSILDTLVEHASKSSDSHAISALTCVIEGFYAFYTNPELRVLPKIADDEEEGLTLFRNDPQKGIDFYIAKNDVSNAKKDIGDFMYKKKDLDKKGLAQILENVDFNESLEQYFCNFEMQKRDFFETFADFLQRIEIPDDLCDIDNVIAAFSQRYYDMNTDEYDSAEEVYNIVYSSIILYANTHFKVCNGLTFEEFSNLVGETKKDLHKIYDDVKNSEIVLDFTHQELFFTREQTLLVYQDRVKSANDCTNKVVLSKILTDEKLLNIYATMSNQFDPSADPFVFNNCLRCLSNAFKISAKLFLYQTAETILDALAKFSVKFAKTEKGRACSDAFCTSVSEVATSLRWLWPVIVRHISNEFIFNGAEEIYASTRRIDNDSLLDFVKAQTTLAVEQLKEEQPVTRMIRRLADVVCYNINRPRYVWRHMWEEISSFYVSADCNQIHYLIASIIQQIVLTYIKHHRIELPSFRNQERLLTPLLGIFRSNREDIRFRKRVVEDIRFIFKDSHYRLRSGWSPLLLIIIESGQECSKEAIGTLEEAITDFGIHVRKYSSMFASALSSVALCSEINDVIHIVPFFTVVLSVVDPEDSIMWKSVFASLLSLCKRSDDICEIAAELALEDSLKYAVIRKKAGDEVWRYLLEVGYATAVNSAKKKALKMRLAGEVLAMIFNEKEDLSKEEVTMFLESIYGTITITECITEAKKHGVKPEIIDLLNNFKSTRR